MGSVFKVSSIFLSFSSSSQSSSHIRPGYEYDGVDEICNEEAEEARHGADVYCANTDNTPTMRTTPTHLRLRIFADMHDQDSKPHPLYALIYFRQSRVVEGFTSLEDIRW
ncbi:hypothetical protein D9758_013718 [Tetrapyrgos nigripes]|uniref:Uncharacterized protein n=1 Tax=Tetrapyrgos nigripes TaxID=182062 RepID=A0A8H5G1Q5_9AGAR|nr:hypothetical protein D9758_013718 [Tetrapyrgos nigripes]